MYSYGPPHMAKQKQHDQLEHTYSSYMRIRDVAQKTSQRQWMIGRSSERGSGISVLAAQHNDEDDIYIYIYIYIYISNTWQQAILHKTNWYSICICSVLKMNIFDPGQSPFSVTTETFDVRCSMSGSVEQITDSHVHIDKCTQVWTELWWDYGSFRANVVLENFPPVINRKK